jgi:Ca-activated chloride channel family protein
VPPADSAAEARRDIENSLPAATSSAPPPSVAPPAQPAGSQSAMPHNAQPLSEQQLAEDQWLRRIPEDPGGLLRRKFLIEHMLRQQQRAQQEPEGSP